MRRCLMMAMTVAFAGCWGGHPRYVTKDGQSVPQEGWGDWLPASTVPFEESGLDENAVYYWEKPKEVIKFGPRHEDLVIPRSISFMRFWRDGRMAFKGHRLRDDQSWGRDHADDMRRAYVGRYAITKNGLYIVEFSVKPSSGWTWVLYKGHVTAEGDVVLTHEKYWFEKDWLESDIYGKKRTFDKLEYKPTW
jgi:hypothetical protein